MIRLIDFPKEQIPIRVVPTPTLDAAIKSL